jgi:elongation factor G
MEKYLDDPEHHGTEEIIAAIRKGTLKWRSLQCCCGSSFKNKGVQTLLDYVLRIPAFT